MGTPRYTLIRVSRNHTGTSRYLEPAMQRIATMSSQFDGAGSTLVSNTWKLFAEGSPYLGLWVAVDEQDQVIGHGLGDIEFWSGRMVAWISQVKMDGPAGHRFKEAFMEAVDQWVEDANYHARCHRYTWQVQEIMMMTPRMTDAWARHAGFDLYRQVYRRLVHTPAPAPAGE